MTELADEVHKLAKLWQKFAQNMYDHENSNDKDLVYADAMRHCAQELLERIEAYE